MELLFEDGLRGNDGCKREIPDPVIADTGIVGGLDTYRGLEFRVQGLGFRVYRCEELRLIGFGIGGFGFQLGVRVCAGCRTPHMYVV